MKESNTHKKLANNFHIDSQRPPNGRITIIKLRIELPTSMSNTATGISPIR